MQPNGNRCGQSRRADCLLLRFFLAFFIAGCSLSSLTGQVFRITDIEFSQAQEVTIRHEADETSYYILFRGGIVSDIRIPADIKLGVATVGELFDLAPLAETGFYRVVRASVDQPLDTDEDGIDDVFELRHPGILHALNPADALEDFDGDGASNLVEFQRGTDLEVPDAALSVFFTKPARDATYLAPGSLDLEVGTTGEVVSVVFLVNGEILQQDDAAPFSANWSNVGVGDYTLTARAVDGDGNQVESRPIRVTLNPPPPEAIASSTATRDSTVGVSGFAVPNSEVVVTGGAATVQGRVAADGRFDLEVPLIRNRLNRLFASILDPSGRVSSQLPLSVLQDSESPFVFIDFPPNNSEVTTPTVDIAGRVGDMLSGFMGLDVSVNGEPAEVVVGIGQNGTFERTNVPLEPGRNVIQVTAADANGNQTAKSIVLNRVEPIGPSFELVSGNNQRGVISRMLPESLEVRLLRSDGSSFSGKVVTFEVIRSNGRLNTDPDSLDAGSLKLNALTDSQGVARAFLTLGMDAGCGNNRVRISSLGVQHPIFFCASAEPGPATQINIGSGNNQRAESGGPAPSPLRVWVSDACNGLAGVPVTFTVLRGGGKVNGSDSVTIPTTITGHSQVDFVLGPEAGNNLVEADFPGNPNRPAYFVLSGLKRNLNQSTSFSGLVLDNSSQPIGGARCVLTVEGQSFPAVLSGVDGRFRIDNVAAGVGHLRVDALPANTLNGQPIPQGSFPALLYEVTVIPDTENSLHTPVLLPPLDPANAKVYDGTEDVILTVAGIDGLEMTVKAGSMVRADGSRPSPSDPAILSLNQVHHDDVPMPMPDGAAPPFAWTLQPAGATFDPPIKIRYPNMSGLPAGAIAYFLSFNHDTERFEIIATGHVEADGAHIVTDDGVGLSLAGWGCNCPPYSVTGDCCGGRELSDCKECNPLTGEVTNKPDGVMCDSDGDGIKDGVCVSGTCVPVTEWDPHTPINDRVSIPWTKNNIAASPGEQMIFNLRGEDRDRRRRKGTAAWTVINGTGPYQIRMTVAGAANWNAKASGTRVVTYNGLITGNVDLFIDDDWDGSTITVTAVFIDNAPPPPSPDIGSTRDPNLTVTWTIVKRGECPTSMVTVDGDPNVWHNAPRVYSYLMNPDVDPPGRPDYEGQTILEKFISVRASNFTLNDLTPEFRNANPTLNTPDKVAIFLWNTSNNGTFVIDGRDQIYDRHGGFGTVEGFTEAAIMRGIGYIKPQTYECGPNTVGRYDITREYKSGTVRVMKTGP